MQKVGEVFLKLIMLTVTITFVISMFLVFKYFIASIF